MYIRARAGDLETGSDIDIYFSNEESLAKYRRLNGKKQAIVEAKIIQQFRDMLHAIRRAPKSATLWDIDDSQAYGGLGFYRDPIRHLDWNIEEFLWWDNGVLPNPARKTLRLFGPTYGIEQPTLRDILVSGLWKVPGVKPNHIHEIRGYFLEIFELSEEMVDPELWPEAPVPQSKTKRK